MSKAIEFTEGGLQVSFVPGTAFNTLRFTGAASDATVRAALLGVWQHPGYVYDRNELYDLREARYDDLSSRGMRELAALNATLFDGHPDHRSAILVSEALMFGLSRVFRAHAGERGDNVEIFTDQAAAVAWLQDPA
ncbi:MAG: hypothetical protein V2I63_09245 [Pseudomonadales bacterium]|nr:hypothetical protein [Pseudomonadales bacterium]